MAASNKSPETRTVCVDNSESEQQQQHQQISMGHHNHHHHNHNHETSGSGSVGVKNTNITAGKQHSSSNFSSSTLPPIVYGEISILGYNGYIPNVERNGRRNKSKFLLCKRPAPNGIKKSRHYIVKQPQATKAIQDKDLHSISYTFSRSQTIIVEYKQDEHTDMFQIGRSSEDPIDFVVMDTLTANIEQSSSSNHHQQQQSSRHHHHRDNENNSSGQQIGGGDLVGGLNRFHRHLTKFGEDMLYGVSPPNDPRNRLHYQRQQAAHQAVLLSYPQPNISNLPPMMADHFRNQDSSAYNQQHHHHHHHHHHHGHSSGTNNQQLVSRSNANNPNNPNSSNNNDQHEHCSSRHNLMCKRSHATQSTISRFACRILVDREPPYTARIYAAGFDSSKNIFLGEKATKWEQNNSIDGLTTNGVLLMHPKQGHFYEENSNSEKLKQQASQTKSKDCDIKSSGDNSDGSASKQICSNNELENSAQDISSAAAVVSSNNNSSEQSSREDSSLNKNNISEHRDHTNEQKDESSTSGSNNNNDEHKQKRNDNDHESGGGVWREVSVDGGIYAIRESRSAAQKGTRIEDETNILQDGTLIDLCGATLLWRSVDGFRASPTKKSLEEKIDLLNASRPQCPVGLNTLIIPRKPILPTNQHHRSGHKDHHHNHHNKDIDKSGHQPYVYLKCGHVQGYHDWGATGKSNQRTCPICLSVGNVAKLSMGLEPSFYVDSGPLTHVFNPCGHMASEKTVRYWCSIKIPHGTHFFHSICPFCSVPLATNEPSSTRLIFQDDLD